MTSLQITNVSKEKKEMKLRSQLFFEKKTMKPKLSIDLVVLLFGFIYVYTVYHKSEYTPHIVEIHFSQL